MNFSSNDNTIIEQALKSAIANSSDYAEIDQFQSVLKKLDKKAVDAQHDGFRYDYNDNAME